MTGLTDEQLMKQLQQGQTEALDELYRRYAKKLYAFCYNIMRAHNPQDVEDLVQDVFVRLIKAAHTFRPEKALFRTWLFRIARNRCLDVIRHKKRVWMASLESGAGQDDLPPGDTLADQGADVEGIVLGNALRKAIRDCIHELENEDERQAIVLYYLAGKVYREIGEIIGKSTSMARNRVKSAQERVRRCLERKGIPPLS